MGAEAAPPDGVALSTGDTSKNTYTINLLGYLDKASYFSACFNRFSMTFITISSLFNSFTLIQIHLSMVSASDHCLPLYYQKGTFLKNA
jgi:hypothetical protein